MTMVATIAVGVGCSVQGWSMISAGGSSTRPPNSSEPVATTIGSYSESRKPKMVAQAKEMVASRIAISATISLPKPRSASSPTMAIVPARPRIAPASFSSVAGSCRVISEVIRKAKIGVVEVSIIVFEVGIYCCDQVMIRNKKIKLINY